MTNAFAVTCAGIAVGLTLLSSSRVEAVDLVAVRAYLRTQADGGDEVTSPTPAQELFVHVAYRLEGAAAARTGRVRALLDGAPLCNGPIDFSPGEHRVWCQTSWAATTGTHVLRWELDGDDQINETDEENNDVEFAFQVGATSVDLVATRAFLRRGLDGDEEVTNPQPGQAVYVALGLRLDGDFGLQASIRAFIDGEQHCGGPADVSPGGTVVRCTNAWTATPGDHTLRWEIDFDGLVPETSEANNTIQATFTVGASAVDLIATRAFLRAQAGDGSELPIPAIGQDVFFEVGYRFLGATSASGTASATIDGDDHCGGDVDFHPGDSITIFCSNAWTAEAGTHLLRWELDLDDEESNDTNNDATLVFGVGGPPGDANCDTRRGIADLLAAVRHIGAGTRAACRLDDADANGMLNAFDVAITGRLIFAPL